MEEAALAAAHEAEEHALLQYQQALMAFERMQQAETHEAEVGRGRRSGAGCLSFAVFSCSRSLMHSALKAGARPCCRPACARR